ncbi:MAG: peroxide stress protein YaaA [Candidatus Nanopelagicales bacterium]
MLILLPPSESKRPPRRGKSLDLSTLSHPELTPLREQVLSALEVLCRDTPADAIEALDLGPTQFDLVAQNAGLSGAATAPASSIYTGVLYAALDFASLRGLELRRANRRIGIVSALFGLLSPPDRICAYRLSGAARLPGIGPLPGFWRSAVSATVARHPGLVVDMLSSPYSSMVGLPPDSVTVKVWQDGPSGQRTAVSHFNKATKGEVARVWATMPTNPGKPDDLVDVLREVGWRAELAGARLDVWRRD